MRYICGIRVLGIFFILGLFFGAKAQYNSLLWEISGNDMKKPSYLYGTMHTTNSTVFHFGKSVQSAFNSCGQYAMELDPEEEMGLDMIAGLMMGEGYSLRKMISDDHYRKLDSVFQKKTGMPLSVFDNMAPIVVMASLQSETIEDRDNSGNKEEMLDMYFYRMAKKKHKKVIGIETASEQIEALKSLTYEEQAKLLEEEMEDLQQSEEESADLLRLYSEQNLDSLLLMSNDSTMPEKFYKALVTDRNRKMAERINSIISDQNTFVAVGALHLPGGEGVIELLRARGFTVRPINIQLKD